MSILASALSLILAAGPAFAEASSSRAAEASSPRKQTAIDAGAGAAKAQAADAADLSAGAASHADPAAAAGAASAAFQESTGRTSQDPLPVRGSRSGTRRPSGLPRGGPQTFKASAVPTLHAAQPGVHAADDKGPAWDYDGTMKAAVFGLAGAAIGFAVGGPIGACVGFLAGFFIGALVWKMSQK